LGFITALCNVVGCDGQASEAERAYIRGMAAIKEYVEDASAQIDTIADAAHTKSLEQIGAEATDAMSVGTLRFAAPIIVYEALKAAAIDGLDAKELRGVYVIAEKMGVLQDQVDKIKDLIAEEEALKKKRIALCVVAGHPCMAEKYKFW
jgi:hypothetical protein